MEKENYTVSENYTGNRNLYDNIYKREKFKETIAFFWTRRKFKRKYSV